jgi:hypothetical protein
MTNWVFIKQLSVYSSLIFDCFRISRNSLAMPDFLFIRKIFSFNFNFLSFYAWIIVLYCLQVSELQCAVSILHHLNGCSELGLPIKNVKSFLSGMSSTCDLCLGNKQQYKQSILVRWEFDVVTNETSTSFMMFSRISSLVDISGEFHHSWLSTVHNDLNEETKRMMDWDDICGSLF